MERDNQTTMKTFDELIDRTRFTYPDGSSVASNSVDVVWNKIKELLTPKLNWKHLYENVWIGKTPFDYTFTIHLEDDFWRIHKTEFKGTLGECKKECEKIFMEMYLNICQ